MPLVFALLLVFVFLCSVASTWSFLSINLFLVFVVLSRPSGWHGAPLGPLACCTLIHAFRPCYSCFDVVDVHSYIADSHRQWGETSTNSECMKEYFFQFPIGHGIRVLEFTGITRSDTISTVSHNLTWLFWFSHFGERLDQCLFSVLPLLAALCFRRFVGLFGYVCPSFEAV